MMKAENGDLGKNIDEKLFRLLVTHVQDYAIFMLDPNGYIMSWNLGAEHIKGYPEEEVIGRHISLFYRKEDIKAGEPSRNLNEALKNGTYHSEGWRVKKDKSEFWADITYTTVYDDDGRLIGFAKVIRDITDSREQLRWHHPVQLQARCDLSQPIGRTHQWLDRQGYCLQRH